MSEPSRGRPRPQSLWSGALCVLATLFALAGFGAGTALADSAGAGLPTWASDTIPPPPPDTVPTAPHDTIPPPVLDPRPPAGADTIPTHTDTVPAEAEPEPEPPALLPTLAAVGPAGWETGVWEWSRTDLLGLPALSLLHLLERIPGITGIRTSPFGQPEAAAVFGATAGAIRYEIDGFELDPLTTPTFDPTRLPLLALEHVRVERRVTGATVRIRTRAPVDARPHSVIEASTGDLRANLFRGTFLAPHVLGGSLALGFESFGSQTLTGGASNHLAGSITWTWVRDGGGVQLAYHQSDMNRTGVGTGLSSLRRDWAVRARQELGPVTAEAFAGASSVEEEIGDLTVHEGTPQGGLRVASALPGPVPMEGSAALRLRSHPGLPAQELEVAGWATPTSWLRVGVDAVHGRWAHGPATGRWTARAQAGPVLGLTVFADLGRADRAVARAHPAVTGDPGDVSDPVLEPARIEFARGGRRLGLQFQRAGVRIGAAAVAVSADSVAGFGLEFDPTAPRFPAGDARGVEITFGLPTGWAPLRFEGWYVDMGVPPGWVYFPAEQWRAGLVYHHLPLPTGNLELFARVEHELRGAMTVPTGAELQTVDAYQATNLELTIRVLTVRAFLRWQNVLHRVGQTDLVGFERPGQHIIYGVKWEFWN